MTKAIKISVELPLEAGKFREYEMQNSVLQKFLKKLEGNFGEVIWYIGMDMFGNDMFERFIFNNGGFMEIMLGSARLEAFFSSKEKSDKFKEALSASIESMFKKKYANNIREETVKSDVAKRG